MSDWIIWTILNIFVPIGLVTGTWMVLYAISRALGKRGL
jgi:hypothetical protein